MGQAETLSPEEWDHPVYLLNHRAGAKEVGSGWSSSSSFEVSAFRNEGQLQNFTIVIQWRVAKPIVRKLQDRHLCIVDALTAAAPTVVLLKTTKAQQSRTIPLHSQQAKVALTNEAASAATTRASTRASTTRGPGRPGATAPKFAAAFACFTSDRHISWDWQSLGLQEAPTAPTGYWTATRTTGACQYKLRSWTSSNFIQVASTMDTGTWARTCCCSLKPCQH